MKKLSLCLVFLMLFLMQAAYANSWGIKGKLLTAVSRDSRWNDYAAVGKQVGDIAVMGARYHNALMLVDKEGNLRIATRAVYQPDDKMDKKLKLTEQKNGFTIAYGTDSRFVFAWFGNECKLIEADHGDIHVSCVLDQLYRVTQQDETILADWNMTLERFNIDLFPRTIEEVRQIEMLSAALESGSKVLNDAELHKNLGSGTAAVYSAPDAKSWRAAKGKAAVGLRGEVWVHGEIVNEKGERYFFIRYDVSERTQRMGYIKSADVKTELSGYDFSQDLVHVPVKARTSTYLTDDPDVSQYQQFTIKQGEVLECLAIYDEFYAYVAYQSSSGTVWGFVPMRDLQPVQDEYRAAQQTVMAQLSGKWRFAAGGSIGPEYMELRADGVCVVHDVQGDDGGVVVSEYTWYVTRYNPAWNLYWQDVPYEITLTAPDGRMYVTGLHIQENGAIFELVSKEGGGSYERVETLPGEAEDAVILDHEPWLDGNG